MTGSPALGLVAVDGDARHPDPDDAGWLRWLISHVDPTWRPGEWGQDCWLFSGALDSDRTAAWRCRTPGCPTVAHRHDGRCDSCRRARAQTELSEEGFDAEPRRRPPRPLAPGTCSVPGCESELHSCGLCLRHERAWRRSRAESLEGFVARARPLRRLDPCLVAGCGRERATSRGLCTFHNNRLRRAHDVASITGQELAGWVATERPRLGAHQFSMVGLHELVRFELLYALQCRDESPPPLDPTQVRILLSRLAGASSVRRADPDAVCESGGQQYNSAIRGLFGDLRRHLERAWAAYTGADPWAGDVWEVALLDLVSNGSRRWPATQGVVDFRPVEPAWLREVLKEWARATRPYLQRLREALRACRIASAVLVASGRTEPAGLGAGDFTHVIDAISAHRRSDGTLHSATHRNLLIYLFCEVVEHGRTTGLMSEVPDPFRPGKRRRVAEDPNEDELGKALPESVIRQLDGHLGLLGPAGRAGSVPAAELQAMQQMIYRLLRDTGRRPGEVVSLLVGCIEVVDGQPNLVYDNHKAARMRRRLPVTTETAEAVLAWERRRAALGGPAATRRWLFPSPLLRSRQALGHLSANCVGRAFRAWAQRIPAIDGELIGPDGAPRAFDRSLITPYALRHSYVISGGSNPVRDVGHEGRGTRASRVSCTCEGPNVCSVNGRVFPLFVGLVGLPGRAGGVAVGRERAVGRGRRGAGPTPGGERLPALPAGSQPVTPHRPRVRRAGSGLPGLVRGRGCRLALDQLGGAGPLQALGGGEPLARRPAVRLDGQCGAHRGVRAAAVLRQDGADRAGGGRTAV